jgi:alanyl-tRNA synthetase
MPPAASGPFPSSNAPSPLSGQAGHWSSARVRSAFIEFFVSRGHSFIPSSPSVPVDDPTLLFTNAGMNQFKPLFLGQADPGTAMGKLRRAVNSQKCIRAGGKHNDLEDVGKDTYHHTFFEMLGNWSFGDYFKQEAVGWSWELLTKVYGIPADRLYATYFGGHPATGLKPDDETRELWLQYLPAARVLPGNMKDNFWEMGDTGPCGPCTEIHVDRIGGRDGARLVNSSDPTLIEVWNNVFIQFNREEGGALRPLPARHVDTGMGFERLVSVLNNVQSNYDTDVFMPLFAAIERITGATAYTGRLGAADAGNKDTAYRVIADHARTLTIAIADGATPSNEGRGYVLRRILRRAVRYGRQTLGAKTGFFAQLVPVVCEQMAPAFPELGQDPRRVMEVVREEEESFARTLDRGIVLFDEACGRALAKSRLAPHHQIAGHSVSVSRDEQGLGVSILAKAQGPERDAAKHPVPAPLAHTRLAAMTSAWADAHFAPAGQNGARGIAAEDAFKLYDTFGFPVDLTELMAAERGMIVDRAGFDRLMDEAKERARAGGKFAAQSADLALSGEAIAKLRALGVQATDDSEKFGGRDVRATVRAIWTGSGFEQVARAGEASLAPVAVVLDRTCCYAEMGGQAGDHGTLEVLGRASGAGEATGGVEARIEDTRAYGGYVAHVCRVVRGELHVGDSVQVRLDHDRRATIAANHTATHLLNLGLREVLGTGVEQKGSLVAPDRLRFDFSHARPVTPEELLKVEQIVEGEVQAGHGVFTGLVPLAKAKAVPGVRAVFGEAYPDPVRVVSVGRSVEALIADGPGGPGASKISAEFCGGTHVENTAQIGGFALLSEEGVAKGIRRIVGLTGVAAKAADEAARGLGARIDAAGVAPVDTDLADEVKAITAQLEALPLPMLARQRLRDKIAGVQEKLKVASKAAAGARASEVAALARSMAASSEWEMMPFIATTIDAGSDKDALAAAISAARQARPKHAVLLISPDPEGGKLTIVAAVPEALVKRGLKAGDWVRETAAACGGKGGGKPDMAQGGGTDLSKVKDSLSAARAHALKAIGA